MNAQSLIVTLLIGLVAGWLASFVMGGGGLVVYLVSGVLGGFVGPWLLRQLGVNLNIGSPLVSDIVVSAIGAILVLFIARLLHI